MANIKDWLLAFEESTKQAIEAIVVGQHDRDGWASDDEDRRPKHQRDVVLSREDGLALVDATFDNGYGGAFCFPIYAWTPDWVCFIYEYDGATSLGCVPRNPVDCEPSFNGGCA